MSTAQLSARLTREFHRSERLRVRLNTEIKDAGMVSLYPEFDQFRPNLAFSLDEIERFGKLAAYGLALAEAIPLMGEKRILSQESIQMLNDIGLRKMGEELGPNFMAAIPPADGKPPALLIPLSYLAQSILFLRIGKEEGFDLSNINVPDRQVSPAQQIVLNFFEEARHLQQMQVGQMALRQHLDGQAIPPIHADWHDKPQAKLYMTDVREQDVRLALQELLATTDVLEKADAIAAEPVVKQSGRGR